MKRKIVGSVRQDEVARRLTAIPGVGPITAATVRAAVPNPGSFGTEGTSLPRSA
ncbi:transposase [Sinorhizobium meliloti]|nr:transposase [Sinorhizobium meliloti]